MAKPQRKQMNAREPATEEQEDDTVYKIVEVVGVSPQSWEDAGRNAVETAAGSLRDLRVAEVTKMDMKVFTPTIARAAPITISKEKWPSIKMQTPLTWRRPASVSTISPQHNQPRTTHRQPPRRD
jgi:flavin-binding protein dodecin